MHPVPYPSPAKPIRLPDPRHNRGTLADRRATKLRQERSGS
jgi:hypothetical protein